MAYIDYSMPKNSSGCWCYM